MPKISVLKFGTTSVCDTATMAIRHAWMQTVAHDIRTLLAQGQQIIVFSSGGLATGRLLTKHAQASSKDVFSKQLLGAVGLSELLYHWQQCLAQEQVVAAPMLIRRDDLENTEVIRVIKDLLDKGIVPVINENIPLQTTFDNDSLAAAVCQAVAADQFILFTDTNGVYSDNPKHNANAHHLSELNINTLSITTKSSDAGLGSGGMQAKLAAAIRIKRLGVYTIIANGQDKHPLSNVQIPGKHTVLVDRKIA